MQKTMKIHNISFDDQNNYPTKTEDTLNENKSKEVKTEYSRYLNNMSFENDNFSLKNSGINILASQNVRPRIKWKREEYF